MKLLNVGIGVLVFAISGCAGMEVAKNADQPIEIVQDAPGKTKDELFSASKSWLAETFVSGKAVIDDADKESGRIIAKGRIPRPCNQGLDCMANNGHMIGFTLRIDTKDGKIRTTYTNLTNIFPPHSGSLVGTVYTPGSYESALAIKLQGDLDAANTGLTALSSSLQQYVTKDSAASKNW